MPVVNSDCFLRRKIDKILISGLLKVAIQEILTFQNSPLSISKLKYSTVEFLLPPKYRDFLS